MPPPNLVSLSFGEDLSAKLPVSTPTTKAAESGRALDEVSWCSTCAPERMEEVQTPCTAGDITPGSADGCEALPVPSDLRRKISKEDARQTVDGYVLSRVVLGGGATGIVQKGVDRLTGCEVAVKRLQRDSSCPLRFLEVQNEAGTSSLHLEGYAAACSRANGYSGRLAFDSANAYAEASFQPFSAQGCVVLVHRGRCGFATKVLNARRGGATGVIIINNEDYTEEYSLGQADHPLPSILIGQADGEAALAFLLKCGPASVALVRTDAEHEAAVCRRITQMPHPHVMRILDTCDGEGGETPCVVCELCTGGKISRSPDGDIHTTLWLLKQILAGIEHLHANGVCHRDIKPDNLLMTQPLGTPDARLVIIDFGMAALTESMTVPCGSARYLAPEVVAGRYGPERDIWAVGVVVYELLWGEHPFPASTDSGMIKALSAPSAIDVPPLRQGCASPSHASCDVPDSVCDLLSRLLERSPVLRRTASQALQHPAIRDIALPS